MSRLIFGVVREIVLLLVPVILAAVLSWQTGALLVIALFAATWLAACMKRVRAASWFSHVLTGLIIGLSISLLRHLPAYWNVPAGLLVFVAGLGVQGIWERRNGLTEKVSGKEPDPDGGRRGASAWGGGWPSHTPEGEPMRVLGAGEIAMGGPVTCDYLFPDGVLLCGLGGSACFSTDGRYFAAPVPSRQAWGLAVLDRRERRLYRSHYAGFWELDEFNAEAIRGRYSPLTSDESSTVSLDELLAGSEVFDLVGVQDLWLTPEWLEHAHQTERKLPAPPAGNHRATATRFLPVSLRGLEYPLMPLSRPSYAIAVNGQASNLLIDNDSPIIWRQDGQALCCQARPMTPGPAPAVGAHWLWTAADGWRPLPHPWVWVGGEPSVACGDLAALDGTSVRIAAHLDHPSPSQGRCGTRLDRVSGDVPAVTGYTPDGRMQTGTCRCTTLRLALPLGSPGGRGAAVVESDPLGIGECARLHWLFDREGGQGVYACRIGDWNLPGQWQLDHRVSDCGGYLALLPAPGEDGVAGEAVVVDVRRRAFIHSRPMLVARLQDFHGGALRLVCIAGRRDEAATGSALQCFQEAAPLPGHASAFLAPRSGSALVYQSLWLAVRDGALVPLPDWRLVDRTQLAIADGDFVYPAPDGRDAAWLFGAATEYDDSWLRENTPRRNGCLLTASGCALGGLAPAMIWSADSRYLALTRLLAARDGRGVRSWQLLLLEPEAGRLYTMADPIGSMPQFERFDASGLRLLVHKYDWLVEDDAGTPRLVSWETLLALPCTPLTRYDGGWRLAPDQEDSLALWQALDRRPLQDWASKA